MIYDDETAIDLDDLEKHSLIFWDQTLASI